MPTRSPRIGRRKYNVLADCCHPGRDVLPVKMRKNLLNFIEKPQKYL